MSGEHFFGLLLNNLCLLLPSHSTGKLRKNRTVSWQVENGTVCQHIEMSDDKWISHLVNGEHFYNCYAAIFLRYCLAIQLES